MPGLLRVRPPRSWTARKPGLIEFRGAVTTFRAVAPGHYVEVKAWTADNLHHDRLWIPWRHCCPTGAILLEGDDIGESIPAWVTRGLVAVVRGNRCHSRDDVSRELARSFTEAVLDAIGD